jgi:hypothetical protein
MWLVVSKRIVEFELHDIMKIGQGDPRVGAFIPENGPFFGDLDHTYKIGMPHLTQDAKPDANTSPIIMKVV